MIQACLNNNGKDINYLSEFYAWAYWHDTGSTELPQRIKDKAKEAKLLCEKKDAEWRQKEKARQQKQAKQLAINLFSRYFYVDDVESGKVPLDSEKMADCLAFREIVVDVKELILADYFMLFPFTKLSKEKPRVLMQCTLLKAAQFETNGKISFANAWNENGKFDPDAFVVRRVRPRKAKGRGRKSKTKQSGKNNTRAICKETV